uniref:RING-type domain-containing protein n=1 Tax=Acrobeloides nanus TaxID=290746 RepID=A0A914DGS4_9BILA
MSGCIAMVARDRLYSHMERCKFVPKTILENKPLLNNLSAIFDCPICLSKFNPRQIITCIPIKAISQSCIIQHIEANIDEVPLAESGDGIKCLILECDRQIHYSKIRRLIRRNDDLIKRLDARFSEQNISLFDCFERCKSCGFAMEIISDTEKHPFFKCILCEADFCRLCKRDRANHFAGKQKIPCQELDAKDTTKKDLLHAFENEMSEAIIRKCPKCGLSFVKQDACNKMTCRCGTTQCYLCRNPNINYDHFCHHGGDFNSKCRYCKKPCRLWAPYESNDEEMLNTIRERATKELGQIGPSTSKKL